MIGLLPILTRWRFGLGVAGILAVLGLLMALNFYRHAYHDEKALRASDKAAYKAAQVKAQAKAFALRQAEKAALEAKAQKGQADYEALKSRYADATARWMRSQAAQGAARGTGSERQADDTGVSAPLPADGVVVSERDLQACSDATAYAVSAHNWALAIGE